MGNSQSQLKGLEIDEKSIEVSDFWTLHNAELTNDTASTPLCVFISDSCIESPLWNLTSPLEKSIENLKKYRHPCIVKYVSSWQKNGKIHLAVENVLPLSAVLMQQSCLQICIGLHSVLKALCFLHEKAQVSHNNMCMSSIYVTNDGGWKLGSMEFSTGVKQLSVDLLKKLRSGRYDKAVDPNEDKHFEENGADFIDSYGFCVLVGEILKGKTDEDIPNLENFRDICKNCLQTVEVKQRPNLQTLLSHDFFNHDFVTIHSFLKELPLKSDPEKEVFFKDLVSRLRNFNQTTVAKQLGNLLLSRMVLLNNIAQEHLLPAIFCLDNDSVSLFTSDTFSEFLSPKLLDIFRVRDLQIRLLILNYFKHFHHTFSKEQLQSVILPELLLGVKDVNEELVCNTLRTLADLVPILGAQVVIGGNRGRVFNDGRPIIHEKSAQHPVDLPERPQPDGEEFDVQSGPEEITQDLDNWEDWEENMTVAVAQTIENDMTDVETIADVAVTTLNQETVKSLTDDVGNAVEYSKKAEVDTVAKKLVDITELDIKTRTVDDGFNFFQDMEPVIESASKFVVQDDASKKFAVDGATGEEGWGSEDWD